METECPQYIHETAITGKPAALDPGPRRGRLLRWCRLRGQRGRLRGFGLGLALRGAAGVAIF